MSKGFLIIFEPDHTTFQKTKSFHDNLTKDPDVKAWWHHIKNTYLIVTTDRASVETVREFVQKRLPNTHFLVLQIRYNNHDGWLPKEAWEWFDSSLKNV